MLRSVQLRLQDIRPLLANSYAAWDRHNAMQIAAALAFYSLLSMAPLVILTVAIIALVYGHSDAQEQLAEQIQSLVGPDGRAAVFSLLKSAGKPASGVLASTAGLCTLLFGASGVFAELRAALNQIWDVDVAKGAGLRRIIADRFFSFGMVLGVGFLLLVSLLLSTGLAALGKWFGGVLPLPEIAIHVVDFLVPLLGIAVLFTLIFKYVPQTHVRLRDVWLGGLVTSFLFSVGKLGIGLYLGKAGVASAYGAAGSLIVVIVWVYYSSLIFLFGAELTHVVAQIRQRKRRGIPIQ